MCVFRWIESHHLQIKASENGILPNQDLPIPKLPSLPTPIARPSTKGNPQSAIVHQVHGSSTRPLGDVWAYIPDWVHDSWRFSSASGVRSPNFALSENL
jgi:hypothetical protein